jgi:hypothetical protein
MNQGLLSAPRSDTPHPNPLRVRVEPRGSMLPCGSMDSGESERPASHEVDKRTWHGRVFS